MGKVRHWKQRFCRDDDFVFRKRLRNGDGWFMPGDPVDKEAIGPNKLRLWWKAGVIEIANWVPPSERQYREPIVEPRGQGWYHVHWRGETHRLRGKPAVEEFLSKAMESRDAA